MAQAYVYEDDTNGWRTFQNGDLPNSGVGAGTYGDASHVSQVTVNSQGVVTAASNVAISGGSGTVSNITSSGGTITVTNGTGPTANVDLPTSGVTAATYGDTTHVASFHVNADGIITSASNVGISGVAGSGLTQLFDSTLGVATASIDTGAGGIAGGHQALVVVIYGKTAVAGTDPGVNVIVNNDSSAIYDFQEWLLSASGNSQANVQTQTSWALDFMGTNASDSYASSIVLWMPEYSATTFWKTASYSYSSPYSQSPAQHSAFGTCGYRATTAISRMKVTGTGGNLAAGTRMTVYGTQ